MRPTCNSPFMCLIRHMMSLVSAAVKALVVVGSSAILAAVGRVSKRSL